MTYPEFVRRKATLLDRFICWLRGHQWRVTRECHRAHLMTHLHALAGCKAYCTRCGREWDDRCTHCRVPHEVHK